MDERDQQRKIRHRLAVLRHAEEMIKLDLRIRNKASGDWRDAILGRRQ
ncbi:MAG: hypothetical protein OXG30_06885 [bacterium]|nr:hypothetical protein [bacterium]